jgi:hypothetical protein
MRTPLLILLCFAYFANAQEVVKVNLPVSTKDNHFSTTILLEEDVSSVIHSFPEDTIVIEIEANKIVVKLVSKTDGFLDISGCEGSIYKVHIVASDKNKFTPFIRLKSQRAKKAHRLKKVKAVEFLKMMRFRAKSSSVSVYKADDKKIIDSDDMDARLLYIYVSEDFRGYVVKLTNLTRVPVNVDPAKFKAEDLILVATEDFELGAGKSTFVYFIFAS